MLILKIENYLNILPANEFPRGEESAILRSKRLRIQIPPQDRNLIEFIKSTWNTRFIHESKDSEQILEEELKEASRFIKIRNENDLGIGKVDHMNETDGQVCYLIIIF